MYTTVKVAAISFKPKKWDKSGNADRLEALFEQAAKQGPRLMLATEGALEGYVVNEVIECPELIPDMMAIAEPVDGPYIKRFQRLAQSLKTCLCFGFAERLDDGLYNCAVFIDENGDIRGKYHKVQLAEGYHPSWRFNRLGSRLRAFDTPIGRCGIVICNDRWNPLIARTLALDGARLILIPSFGSRKREQNQAVLARARENGVPIVEANVGVNMIVSKGEVVAYKWGINQITLGEIDIPAPTSPEAARRCEQEYLAQQGPEMEKRYQETMKKIAKKRSESNLAR
jgi:predicted amidohydrolase